MSPISTKAGQAAFQCRVHGRSRIIVSDSVDPRLRTRSLAGLDPLIGSVYVNSFFVVTYRTYFPLLACEVKSGAAALDIADRQNTHSMTVTARAVFELYSAVKREEELHREILAFSISHGHRLVRIYGHYPMIDGSKTTFYRHPIHTFDFTALNGKDKWTAYKLYLLLRRYPKIPTSIPRSQADSINQDANTIALAAAFYDAGDIRLHEFEKVIELGRRKL